MPCMGHIRVKPERRDKATDCRFVPHNLTTATAVDYNQRVITMTPQELHTFVQNAPKGTLVVLNLTNVDHYDDYDDETYVSRVVADSFLDGTTRVSELVGYGYDLSIRRYPQDFDELDDSYEIVAIIPPLTKRQIVVLSTTT